MTVIIDKAWRELDTLIANHINFALYRLPGESDIQLVLQTSNSQLVTFNHLQEIHHQIKGFLIAPFQTLANKPIVLIQPDFELTGQTTILDYIQSLKLPFKNPFLSLSKSPTVANKEQLTKHELIRYNSAYTNFHQALKDGKFNKIVLSRAKELTPDASFSPGIAFKHACIKYPKNFIYLCHTTATGSWIGSTPELLVSGRHDEWHTVALAGTQNIADTLNEKNIKWDDKNRQEQQIVVNYIYNQLQNLRLPSKINPVQTIRSGNVAHLKSEINFQLPNHAILGQLLEKLHPTPAVCGAPKKEAFDFIIQHEGYDRQYYSGFLGYINPAAQTNLFVNLRCAQILPDMIRLYAGGGLLPTSKQEDEWQETELKLQTILSIIKPHSPL